MSARHIDNLRKIFLAGVEAVKPKNIFCNKSQVQFDTRSEILSVQNVQIPTEYKNVHMVGFGKAVFLMAAEIERLMGSKFASGCINVPVGTKERYPEQSLLVTKVIESAENNLPDEKSVEAAKEILSRVGHLSEKDILLVLISGGGSALLPLPKKGISLQNKLDLIKQLQRKGADIKELNAVRISLSESKGGKLAKAAEKCSNVIGLIISDIVKDPVDLIASGPTVKPFLNGREVLEKYDLWNSLLPALKSSFDEKFEADLRNVQNFVIANNSLAVQNCVSEAEKFGYKPFILTTILEGEVQEVQRNYKILLKSILNYQRGKSNEINLHQLPFENSKEIAKFLDDTKEQDICFIVSGETTVNINGTGKGGRNQELSLRMSKMFFENEEMKSLVFLSAGTDGIDGPTDVAGAVGFGEAIVDIKKCEDSLNENDSYNYFKNFEDGKYFVKTGHTGTNVMDIHLIMIPK